VAFVMAVIEKCFRTSTALVLGIALVLVCLMVFSRWLKKQSIFMERTFIQNFRYREMHEEFTGKKRPEYEGHLLSRDLHLSDFVIPAESGISMASTWRPSSAACVASTSRAPTSVCSPATPSR
jgi:CPA2 family monovalent cation:H+ antiporter-2